MSRPSRPFIVASLSVGAFLAVLLVTHVVAQTQALPPGMRSALDDDPTRAPAKSGKTKKQRNVDPTKAGQIPVYGVPPGAGAGQSGFVSTNVPRRKTKAKTKAATKTGFFDNSPLQGPPLPLTPPAPSPQTPPQSADASAPQPPARPGSLAAGPVAPAGFPPRPAPRKKAPTDADPYDQLGVRVDGFVLRPAIETSVGYDSNPNRVTNGRGSAFVTVAPDLQLRSEWQRHELTAVIRGSYTAYEATPQVDRPNLDAKVNGRIDVTDRTRINLEGRFLAATDNPGSPNLPADLARLPIYTTTGGTVGVTQRLNRFELALKVSFDRTVYANSKLTDGTIVDNTDRNFDQRGVLVRGSYELTPGIRPFVEASFDTRVHDLPVDAFGIDRDSRGWTAKVGTTFEFTRTLTGELAIGYLARTYKDPTLPDLRGVLADASLVWAVSGLTTAKLTARTTADESTQVGVSGVLRHDFGIEVEHAFRRWLVGTLKFGYGIDDYRGSEREDMRYVASAALTYKITRWMQIKGELREEWLQSNQPGNNYNAIIALIGLRWQP